MKDRSAISGLLEDGHSMIGEETVYEVNILFRILIEILQEIKDAAK
jgi:hypothetical protein